MTNVYTQTNETQNKIINFKRSDDGQLSEVQRVPTGGKGTNGFTPLTGEASSPDSLISSNSIIVSSSLFAGNSGMRAGVGVNDGEARLFCPPGGEFPHRLA